MAVRRRRWRPDFGGCGLLLALAAGSVVVAVRWVADHPEVIAFVVILGALGGVGGSRVSGRAVGRQVDRVASAAEFEAMTPGEFEQAIADLCWRDGCRDVRVVGGAGDLAADVLATLPDGRRVLIQCKRYAPGNPVRSPEVQQVGGTYQLVHGADLAIVVTTSVYTAAAVRYAHAAGIRLLGGGGLAAWAAGGVPPWA